MLYIKNNKYFVLFIVKNNKYFVLFIVKNKHFLKYLYLKISV